MAYYDGLIEIDLSKIKPMIAMPFHPSNTYTIEEVNGNLMDILDDVEKRAAVSLDHISVGKYRSDNSQGNVLRAYALLGLSRKIYGNHAGHIDVIGLVQKLLYKLRPAFLIS